jgi:hypothetical protein
MYFYNCINTINKVNLPGRLSHCTCFQLISQWKSCAQSGNIYNTIVFSR